MKVGDITIATDSYFENDHKIYRPKSDLSIINSLLPSSIPGTNMTVESIIKETEAIKSAKSNYFKPNTVSIDMETAYLYKESINPSASVMVVTDLPKSRLFYEKHTDIEHEQIARRQTKLVKAILELADLL